MSAAILDRARAFEMIASHLAPERAKEIAAAIGDKILAEVGGPKPEGGRVRLVSTLTDPAPRVEAVPDEHDEVVAFLTSHGWAGVDLVKATVRLTEYLKHHKELTREAGMRVWLGAEKDKP